MELVLSDSLSFSDILWHQTKNYCPKVFLLTEIKLEYSDILYNQTHFPGPLVCRIRQVPLYIYNCTWHLFFATTNLIKPRLYTKIIIWMDNEYIIYTVPLLYIYKATPLIRPDFSLSCTEIVKYKQILNFSCQKRPSLIFIVGKEGLL